MPTLKAENIVRRFGGLVAVDNLSFEVDKGEILGIIGPNGAGKTTVINLIAGTLAVNKGSIKFNGEDVTNNPAHIRNRKGIARTFQIVRPLENFSAIENIMVGSLFGEGEKLSDARNSALEICDFLKLENVNKSIDELTVLELKKVELGRALASDPELLFLDEIMAGLTSEETWELIDIVKKLHERDIAIVVVEHIMKVVKELTHRVIVLNKGATIAEGPYEKVSQNKEVIAAYLGEEE
ncbi:MAG TPA: ABC transporter ATP-binding protein [Halanaerobiales bacterium]|nr:ABC transporter ATP-binding protein [Halanaerobiales bacterium]